VSVLGARKGHAIRLKALIGELCNYYLIDPFLNVFVVLKSVALAASTVVFAPAYALAFSRTAVTFALTQKYKVEDTPGADRGKKKTSYKYKLLTHDQILR